jgi:predicted aspartyl protease
MRWTLPPLLALALPAGAQVAPVAPAPPAAQPPADLLDLGESRDRMTVPVSIAGAGPYRFIIDTGAQRTVISRELAGTLGLARGRDVRLTAMTEVSLVGTVVIPSIGVSTVTGPRIEAPLLSGQHLGAPGMLGIDSLQGHQVVIDFDKRQMAVRPSSRRRRVYPDRLPGEIVVKARSLFGQLVVTDAYCDGQRIRVVLDTGSAVSMGNLALRRKFAKKRLFGPVTLVDVTGGELRADYGAIRTVKIGDITVNDLPVAFADAPPFKQFGLSDVPAMLLGMDALKLFRRVQIDFANRELRLAPPKDA